MTWEELKTKAKEMGGTIMKTYSGEEFIGFGRFFYRQSGAIDNGLFYGNIADKRTPEQMLMIMRGLE